MDINPKSKLKSQNKSISLRSNYENPSQRSLDIVLITNEELKDQILRKALNNKRICYGCTPCTKTI